MGWFRHRARFFLFAVIAFLVLVVVAVGVIRVVYPELNLAEAVGFADDDKPATFKTKPHWKQLTAEQREALFPLEKEWDRISHSRKKKWLEIAQRMQKLSPEEKKRFQERLRVWVNLTPEERKEARQNYLDAKKLGVKDKSLQWLEYQNLPEEEKKALAAKARKKRRVADQKPSGEASAPVVTPQPVEKPRSPEKTKEESSPDYWK